MEYIKFTGAFKILKPLGFEFGKYFASNHKAYSKKHGEYITDMHIWVKGRDIQLENFNTLMSYYIAKHIINDTYPVYSETKICKLNDKFSFTFEKGESKDNMLNTNTGEITSRSKLMVDYGVIDAIKRGEELNETHKYSKDGWREAIMSKRVISLVKEFYSKGLIELIEYRQ